MSRIMVATLMACFSAGLAFGEEPPTPANVTD